MGLASVDTEYVVAESGTCADEMLLRVDSVRERSRKLAGLKCRFSGKRFRGWCTSASGPGAGLSPKPCRDGRRV